MRRSFILIHANLRKAKGQTAAIIVLTILAAVLLNLWLMLSMDYKQNFERYHDKLNAEHVLFLADNDSAEMQGFLRKNLENDKSIAEFSLESAMHMVGTFAYNGGEINSNFLVLEKEAALSRSIGKVEIIEDSSIQSGLYMPMLYKSEDIAIGKEITISIGSDKVTYTICGFFNSVMAGSNNCAVCELVLTQDKYQELEGLGYASKATVCSVRLKDKTESESYETTLKNMVSSEYPLVSIVSTSYALVTQSRYISQMICSSIMSAMACFILLIALVVIASNIVNYIQENMRNLGAWKAVGYTGRQLVSILLLQFGGISLVAAIVGAGISYCLFPFVNEMMISQMGIPYAVHFLPVPLLLTLVILGGTVAAVVWLSARRIKKIEPITALRQGVKTHNFKHNHMPLEKAKAPLQLALALKTTLSGMKYNITVCITMLVLSLVVVFAGVMLENVMIDVTPFLEMIVGETADSCINVNVGAEKQFLQEMEADGKVEKVYLYHSIDVSHVGGLELLATLCDDFSKVNNQHVIIEGRFPRYDNEIAIAAKYAGEKGLKIGDGMTITTGGKEAEYIISGFTQTTNNLGKDCLLTRAGYERLEELQYTSYYLNLAEGNEIDAFNQEIKERFGDEVNMVINIESTIDGAASVYVSLMTVIVIAVLVLSVVIITFVLYLLVRTMLNNKKQDYGIMKALGFTTGELILQTALSFMPATILSVVVGLIVNSMIINPLIALFLHGIGIVECDYMIPIGFIVTAGIGLIVFAFVMACLLSVKIRKIAPRALLSGD